MSEEKSVQPILFMSMDDPMFEVHGPDGHVWMIRNSGITSGFPEGAMVINHVQSKLNMLIGLMLKNARRSPTASAGSAGGGISAPNTKIMRPSEPPTFEATWWPVWLETVPGSGERIHVAVVVQPMHGKGTQVRQLISPPTLRAMFGLAGNGLQVVVGETVLAIQQQLDAGINPDKLDMPFGGQGLGRSRECLAHDLEEVFSVATRMAGAFGVSQFGGGDAPAAGQLFVIRCIPDPFTGEMFNIGVCATDMSGNRVAKVLTEPGRLECMYGEAAGHVVALAAVAKEAAESGGPAPSSQIVFDTPTDYYGGSAEEAAANAFADQVTAALPFNRRFLAAQQP